MCVRLLGVPADILEGGQLPSLMHFQYCDGTVKVSLLSSCTCTMQCVHICCCDGPCGSDGLHGDGGPASCEYFQNVSSMAIDIRFDLVMKVNSFSLRNNKPCSLRAEPVPLQLRKQCGDIHHMPHSALVRPLLNVLDIILRATIGRSSQLQQVHRHSVSDPSDTLCAGAWRTHQYNTIAIIPSQSQI